MKVGAATETEIREKKHRLEDALRAPRAALEEGIVPAAASRCSGPQGHPSRRPRGRGREDRREDRGARARGAAAPIADNGGLEGQSWSTTSVRPRGHGINAITGEIVDLVAAGVIDPAMVTRSALQNAASIAKNILTTEAIVAEIPDKESGGGGGGMPDMSGMM